MVYVQDINGKPMMPTTRYGKVRRLLKENKAVDGKPMSVYHQINVRNIRLQTRNCVRRQVKNIRKEINLVFGMLESMFWQGMGINVSIVKENQKIISLMFITLNPEKREVIPLLILLPYVKLVIKNTIKAI